MNMDVKATYLRASRPPFSSGSPAPHHVISGSLTMTPAPTPATSTMNISSSGSWRLGPSESELSFSENPAYRYEFVFEEFLYRISIDSAGGHVTDGGPIPDAAMDLLTEWSLANPVQHAAQWFVKYAI